MARIRIIDEWLRSPVSEPSRRRAVLVVADSWSEQRVLMRAFAASPDQTRPAITLRGVDLAISPAGVDPHGPWGIHVEPPVDGRAQELRAQLEEAARRLAGARRSPPRLVDEEPPFDKRPTNVWIPERHRDASLETPAPPSAPAQASSGRRRAAKDTEDLFPVRKASRRAPRERASSEAAPSRRTSTDAAPSRQTITGVAPRPAVAPASADPLAAMVHRTMPLGFQLTAAEREVLNALGKRGELAASEIAALAGAGDGAAWMEALMGKLAEHGLDLVEPGQAPGGAVVFQLRR